MMNTVEGLDNKIVQLDSLNKDSSIDTKTNSEDSTKMEDELDFPPDEDILEMVKEVDLNNPLPTVTERYFTTYYRIDFPKKLDDICIRMHTNRLCMISLAPSHPIFYNDRKIEKIDFQVTDKLNRANNSVSGKSKHGAQPLHETSKICSITCSNGENWIIRCGINGKLTEVNMDLINNPELLRQPPHKGGYLAIVLPKINAAEKMKNYLITQEAYEAAIEERLHGKIENGVNRANGALKRPCNDEDSNPDCKEKIMKTEAAEKDCKNVDETLVSSTLPCI